MLIFRKKNAYISKINKVLVLKGIFSETIYMCVCVCLYLSAKFQVSSIIITSFRLAGGGGGGGGRG